MDTQDTQIIELNQENLAAVAGGMNSLSSIFALILANQSGDSRSDTGKAG